MKNEWEQLDDRRIVIWLQKPQVLGGNIRLYTVVSDEQMGIADQFPNTWNAHLNRHSGKWYVRGELYEGAKKVGRFFMHRYLLGLDSGNRTQIYADHKCPEDTLNSCSDNLRLATPSENSLNIRVESKYGRGVTKCTKGPRYQARTQINGVSYHLGTYDTARDARIAVEAINSILNPFAVTTPEPPDAIYIPGSRSIFPIVPDHIYEKAGVLHLKERQLTAVN